MMSLESTPRDDLTPRGALSVNDMMAMMGPEFDDMAATEAALSWPQSGESKFVTSTVAPVGGHRRNHE
ncbi:hypothetical protein BGX31_002622 [Mortierella sp. GBA43]|nr:hypothetical protein BGX31_002622 [Mortierella sp. GBA43]